MHSEALCFGPFTLNSRKRLLHRDSVPIKIGGRAMDVLIVLTQRSGQIITKQELAETVWRGLAVEDVTIRSQIAALRRVLHDGSGENRFILSRGGATVSSRR